jgi:membrane protease YdiL (CAAX protease family)
VADAVVAGGTYAAVIMIAIAVSAVAATLARWLPEIETAVTPAVQWRFTKPALIPAALISSLCIGYREEVFFRAYLFDRASEVGIRPVGAITGGSLLFAVGHIYQGVAGFLVASLLGLILGAIYWRRKSLHGVAVAHALYNLSVLLISGPFAGQVG